MRVRIAAGAASALLIAGTVTGCGANSVQRAADTVDQAGTVLAALKRSAAKADDLGSAQVESTVSMPGAQGIEMDGTYSWGDGLAYDVEMDADKLGMRELASDGSVRALFVDGAYYYEVDAQPSGPLKGKHWMKIDASAVLGQGASALSESGGNPVAGLRYIGLSDDVEKVGAETILGRKTTHYSGTLTKKNFGRAKELLAPEEENTLMNSFTGGGVTSVSIDIWVDGKDLPARIQQKVGKASITLDFKSFDTAKKVTAPPAADTVDMTEEVKASAGQS
ncbi:hypothetical protein [Streptomyces sp. NPDC002187]|uniref:hypothetical protein n=1 Tax=Streptomyces sp. NPDC002187 TaxID=3364637 RepID=UPI0036B1764F